MNAAAPPAPIAAAGASEGGKNRKPRGAQPPSGLVRGIDKGSAQFQEILDARAARQKSTGTAVASAAARAAALSAAKLQAEEAAGLKNLLAALLAKAQGASGAAVAATLNAEAHSTEPGASAASKKESLKKNPARTLVALFAPGAAVSAHAGAHTPATAAGKEQKEIAHALAKAPALDAKSTAHRSEPLIHVVDLRRHEKAPAEGGSARKLDPAPSQDRDASSSLVTRPVLKDAAFEPAPRPAVSASQAATPLERLREMAGSELVRASHLVLKDGGGEIRLVLKPESLGSVRVRMNMVDNSIEGRIIVDSSAIKHVLDGSVDALRRALTAEGFQMGSLQVSVGGQDAQSDPRREQEQEPAEIRRIAARGFERSVPGAEDVSLGDLFVNLFV